jgi:hypothetical protein
MGRRAELEQLEAAFRTRRRHQSPRRVVLTGDAYPATRLAREFVSRMASMQRFCPAGAAPTATRRSAADSGASVRSGPVERVLAGDADADRASAQLREPAEASRESAP